MLGEFAQWAKGGFIHWKVSNSLIIDGSDCKSQNYIPLNTQVSFPLARFEKDMPTAISTSP